MELSTTGSNYGRADIHWYEELFDAVFQFVAILDEHGTIIKANQAAIELTA